MSGFIYFIKCEKGELERMIQTTGLKDYADKIGVKTRVEYDGGGYIFELEGKSKGLRPRFDESLECVEFNDFKLFYDKENKPKPEDFLRDDFIDGKYVELADGNNWIIPIARKVESGSSHLPHHIMRIEKGKILKVPFEKYARLVEVADEVWDDLLLGYDEESKEHFKIVSNDEKILDAFEVIIATNYDLDWFEVSALKLMSTHNITSVLYTLVDQETLSNYIDEEKKNGCLTE